MAMEQVLNKNCWGQYVDLDNVECSDRGSPFTGTKLSHMMLVNKPRLLVGSQIDLNPEASDSAGFVFSQHEAIGSDLASSLESGYSQSWLDDEINGLASSNSFQNEDMMFALDLDFR